MTKHDDQGAMGRCMATQYCHIRGYEGLEMVLDKKIPLGCLTTEQLKGLLRCLTARPSLSNEEIVGAYVKRRTKLAHDLLLICKHGPYHEYSCGTDPHFIAVNGKGNRVAAS